MKKDVSSPVERIVNAICNVATQASDAISSRSLDLDIILELIKGIGPSGTLANDALWQEAISFDTKVNGSTHNQLFYQTIASVQRAEDSSYGTSSDPLSYSSYASRGLQALNLYPARFNQHQAGDPAESLGGLQLSGYRYNLGASGSNGSFVVSTPGRGVQSFMKSDGSYDWSQDAPGYYYLQAASEARVLSITAFVNSMPSALSESGKPCGNNLSITTVPQFVAYITTVLSHISEDGIDIEYVSPMNEPDNSFESCTQEGMSVDKDLRAEVFQQLRAALLASTSPAVRNIKIMGDETSQIASQALIEYGSWLTPTLSKKSLDVIAVHMYDWPDDATLLNYRQLVINSSLPSSPPPIKMTEISSFKTASGIRAPWGWTGPSIMGPEYDPGISSALDMARYIWQWLALVNAESWDWWTAVSNMMPCSPSITPDCASTYSTAGFNDGLLYIDPNYATTKDYNFYFTKRYWAFKHFTKFLRPGAVRFDIPNEILPYGTVAIAAKNTNDVYSTIFVNRNATEQAIKMKLPGVGGNISSAVQTTDKDDFGNVPVPVVDADGIFRITLPARGILSIQFTTGTSAAGPKADKRGSVITRRSLVQGQKGEKPRDRKLK
ncbi:MAG: hypothetical protein Q9209_002484 [Squamulea sp. 1 TL-2023]